MFEKYICIKQHDINDYEVACLITICKQYGIKISVSAIRQILKINQSMDSTYNIIKVAENVGLSAKYIKIKNQDEIFSEIPVPSLVQVMNESNSKYYAVIHKIDKKKVIIADPIKGIKKYNINDFFKIWTKDLILISPNHTFIGDKTRNSFLSFFKLLIPHKKLLINIFFCSILITLFGILGSFYLKFLIDDIIPYNIKNTLHVISISVVMLHIFRISLNALRKQLLLYLSQKLDISLMLGYYYHMIDLPISFFDTRNVGQIVSRFNDVYNIRMAISDTALTIMMDSLMVLVGAIILYFQEKTLFEISLILVILFILFILGFNKPLNSVNRQVMISNADLTSYLVEALNGIETVKSFNGEKIAKFNIEKRFIRVLKSILKSNTISNIYSSLKEGVRSLFTIIILWVGAYKVLEGSISLGQLLVFNTLLSYFLNPIENLINLQPQIQTAIVAAERLKESVDLAPEKDLDEMRKISCKSLNGDIQFKDIIFGYNSGQPILKDLNLNIKSGERIAIVGESGLGKTTIVKLLLNFYRPQKGEILIDNYNIQDINKEFLRDRIAYISQNLFLFSGTIRENLEFGNINVTFEEIVDACKKAQAHKFINKFPLRYDTYIEENGSNLSGGQKQRLAIARAILRKPDILIMDEATSNLDPNTEKAIESTMYNFSQNVTTIVITHRLSTIKRCDRIFVIDNGRIMESGTHEELLVLGGRYHELWKSQRVDNDKILQSQLAATITGEDIK